MDIVIISHNSALKGTPGILLGEALIESACLVPGTRKNDSRNSASMYLVYARAIYCDPRAESSKVLK